MSSEYSIDNFMNSLKDKVIILINVVILVVLLLIIYVSFLQDLVGTTSISIIQLLFAILLAMISTISFDLLKIKR